MRRRFVLSASYGALACCLWMGMAYAISNGEKVNITGLITGRDGDTLTMRTLESGNVIVELTDDTKVVEPKGILKLRKKEMGITALMPGLKIQVAGMGNAQSHVIAKTIKFSKNDLRTAEAIQAGLTPTQEAVQTNKENIQTNKEEIAANKQQITANQQQIGTNEQDIVDVNKRFTQLSEYDVRYAATVYFDSGSTVLSEQDKTSIRNLANDAVTQSGYIVQVKGYADSSGNAAMNQKLSMERAQEVIAYLLQECDVPLRHIVAPGAMGEADPAAPNETSQGRKENRRVELAVLVNRGVSAAK